MKLVVLSDNRQVDESLESEHGLCIYMETDKYKCLLDTGASNQFIRNAEKLNINLKDVDYVFISHGHSDHTGGLQAFLEINSKAQIIISRQALSYRFFSSRNGIKKIGTDIDIEGIENRFLFVENEMLIENEIHVFAAKMHDFPSPKANKTLMRKLEDKLVADDFQHELIVTFGIEKMVVYSGCAHCGVLNILDSVKQTLHGPVSVLIGGFHLLDGSKGQYETESDITTIAESIHSLYPETAFITGHCTGDNVYGILKKKLQDNLTRFYTGYTISFIYN